MAVVIAVLLYVTGILGGKDEEVQVAADNVAQETPSVSEEAVENPEKSEGDKQEDISGDSNIKDMAWEAFQAYKVMIDDVRAGWDDEEHLGPYDSGHRFALIYLDDDNYPELLVHQTKLVGIDNGGEWTTIDSEDNTDGSDIVWGENIDEAYVELLNRNK